MAQLWGVKRDPYCEIATVLGQANLLQKLSYLGQIFIEHTGDMVECNDLLFTNCWGGSVSIATCKHKRNFFSSLALIQWSMFHLYGFKIYIIAFYRQKYIPLPNLVRIGQFVLSNDLPLNCRTSKNVTFSCPVFSTFLNNKIHLRHSKQVNVIKTWIKKYLNNV